MLRFNPRKSKVAKISRFLLVFVLMTGWIFSGVWQIWQNPQIPPKIQEARAGTVTYDTAATHVWHSPVGVTSVDVECWGAGGAGGGGNVAAKDGGQGGGGGGGGAYAKTTGISITEDTDYNVVVGVGASGNTGDGSAGADSYFDDGIQIKAKGGSGGSAYSSGGTGGTGGTGNTGDIKNNGGNGSNHPGDNTGGGGGESAGAILDGTTATGQAGASGVADGGDGGNGGDAAGNGYQGSAPGGGGGGGGQRSGGSESGGNGAVGKCILTWTDPLATTIAIKSQDYATSVSNITFPAGDPSAVVSLPTNGIGVEVQTFSATPGDAKPVITLVNTVATAYNIWYNITAFSNSAVSNESYVIIAKGGACADAAAINQSATLDSADHVTTGTVTTIAATGDGGEADERDLYLKVTLSASSGKTGTSTLTILGEVL